MTNALMVDALLTLCRLHVTEQKTFHRQLKLTNTQSKCIKHVQGVFYSVNSELNLRSRRRQHQQCSLIKGYETCAGAFLCKLQNVSRNMVGKVHQ